MRWSLLLALPVAILLKTQAAPILDHIVETLNADKLPTYAYLTASGRMASEEESTRCGNTCRFLHAISSPVSPLTQPEYTYTGGYDPSLQADLDLFHNFLVLNPYGAPYWDSELAKSLELIPYEHHDDNTDKLVRVGLQVERVRCLLGLRAWPHCQHLFLLEHPHRGFFTIQQPTTSMLVCLHTLEHFDHVFCIYRDDTHYYVLQSFVHVYSLQLYLTQNVNAHLFMGGTKPFVKMGLRPMSAEQADAYLREYLDLQTLPLTVSEFQKRYLRLFKSTAMHVQTPGPEAVVRTSVLELSFSEVDPGLPRKALDRLRFGNDVGSIGMKQPATNEADYGSTLIHFIASKAYVPLNEASVLAARLDVEVEETMERMEVAHRGAIRIPKKGTKSEHSGSWVSSWSSSNLLASTFPKTSSIGDDDNAF